MRLNNIVKGLMRLMRLKVRGLNKGVMRLRLWLMYTGVGLMLVRLATLE